MSRKLRYVYDAEQRRLRDIFGKKIDNSLGYTCKKVAQEIEAMAFRCNKVTFHPRMSSYKAIDIPSDASLFEELLWRKHRALQFMLRFLFRHTTAEVLDDLCTKWPGVQVVEGLRHKIQDVGSDYFRDGTLDLYSFDYRVDRHMVVEVLEVLIDLLATRSDFEALTAIGYTTSAGFRFQMRTMLSDEEMEDIYEDTDFYVEEGDDFVDDETGKAIYTRETQPQILKWRPKLWHMPNRQELLSIESFLPGPCPKARISSSGCEYVGKLHFSATAVAIDFLERLSPKQRSNLRELHIQEDRTSINQPYRHSQGLIPLCQGNPQLHITQRVDIWQTDLIPNSDSEDWIHHAIWWSIFRWMQEVKNLHAKGMPDGSFSLVLHGPSADASQNLADTIIKVAAWQDANAEYFRRHQAEFHPYRNGVISGFPEIVKEVLQGTIPVSLESEISHEIWDTAKILREHEGPWPTDFAEAVPEHPFNEPAGGWEAARNEHRIEVDYLERFEGWDRLLEGE
ncbi:hypothetical protein HBI25_093210 [Parastagonospora nodorum]|nr:hypothetical protein HBH53_061330 [Parastagonospora nodorum]KAH3975729.1 hypothetical protein HBH52_125510 [Parastagonospora nodorum]KAH4032508.1 hypothetical protein HBI09_119720 [Parastagonospora nodorum]KAH4206238.1 hypothetical protein HBI95_125880 [Parastagonospora nodorum]KAH5007519.1 hypothetical protein HBI77_104730 [Parastagonospora nodorum]